ncbi:MAG: TetR/AcrR family transcriptional regulator [Steroidobacteraceae bacterium]
MRRREQTEPVRHIPEALLEAAATGLLKKNHNELTAREIASQAGTTQGMIKYYFEGKDGLFLTLLDESHDLLYQLDAIIADIHPTGPSPTRRLVATMLKHYDSRRGMFRFLLDGLGNPDSRISREYVSRRLPRAHSRMCKVITTAQAAGIYRKDMDPTYASFVLTCFAIAPVAVGGIIEHFNMGADELTGDRWIDFLSGMVDREFCNPAQTVS